MPEKPKLAKATLQEISWTKSGKVEEKTAAGKPSTAIEVQFNPATLKVNYSNQKAGGDQPSGSPVQFVGKGTTKLTLELVFDTTILEVKGPSGPPPDVRVKVKDIFNFMKPTASGTGKKQKLIPPGVRFLWGSFLFEGVVDSMDENLEFFSSSGVPMRATVSLALSQQELQFQVGTAAAEAAGTSAFEEAKAGDSVQQMAAKAGNPDWKGVALANGIENPRRLAPGALVNLSATGVSASLGGSLGNVGLGDTSFGISAGSLFGGGTSVAGSATFGASASFAASASLGGIASAGGSASFGAAASLSGGLAAGVGVTAGVGLSLDASTSLSAGASASASASASLSVGGDGFSADASASADVSVR